MSKPIRITCTGLPKAIARLKELGVSAPIAVARGMRSWGEQTRTQAIKVTPKMWGALRDSIYVDQSLKSGKATLNIGAGGPAAPYAVVVHENFGRTRSKYHSIKWTTAGTGPKYLENPIRERMPLMDGEISQEIEEELKRFK